MEGPSYPVVLNNTQTARLPPGKTGRSLLRKERRHVFFASTLNISFIIRFYLSSSVLLIQLVGLFCCPLLLFLYSISKILLSYCGHFNKYPVYMLLWANKKKACFYYLSYHVLILLSGKFFLTCHHVFNTVTWNDNPVNFYALPGLTLSSVPLLLLFGDILLKKRKAKLKPHGLILAFHTTAPPSYVLL